MPHPIRVTAIEKASAKTEPHWLWTLRAPTTSPTAASHAVPSSNTSAAGAGSSSPECAT